MFLLITSLIFNGFSIRKKFWKAETQGFSTISLNTAYIKGCWRCQRYIKYTYENPLNIKKVMSKNMFVHILSFFWSLWSFIHIYQHLRHLQHESYYIVFDPLLRYFTSLTSLTWTQCIRLHCQRCQRLCTQCLPCYLIRIGSICKSKK